MCHWVFVILETHILASQSLFAPPAPPCKNKSPCQNNMSCSVRNFFSCDLGLGMVFGDTDYCAACCHMCGCPCVQTIVHGLGTEVVPMLVSSEGARKTTPLSDQQEVGFSVIFGAIIIIVTRDEGQRGVRCWIKLL